MAQAGCSPAPVTVVGRWTCRSPSNATGDSVDIKQDGTMTVTRPDSQSASGTWTFAGATLTVHGLGPAGSEDFAFAGDELTGQGAQVCTRS
jgi:hypothetical protein